MAELCVNEKPKPVLQLRARHVAPIDTWCNVDPLYHAYYGPWSQHWSCHARVIYPHETHYQSYSFHDLLFKERI